MFASSFYDVVIGIDIHWEFVPPPMVPTPFPNPFIGIVLDPMGLACGLVISAVSAAWSGTPMTGPVFYYTAFPATNTGTEAKGIPGHMIIPPGISWAPMPKTPKPKIHPKEPISPPKPVSPDNDAVAITGSKTVLVGGSNACRLGDIMLSCSEPLRLPSSFIIAVPKGLPILIGGPPSLDVLAAVLASLRTRFVSDSLHALVSRLPFRRLRNALHWLVCVFTGHPVDVASGKVVTDFVDADLPGPLPLRITRQYSSAFGSRLSPVGCGWSWSLDQAIWRERGKVVMLAEDGREIEFDTFDFDRHAMRPGQELRHPIERLTLRCLEGERWEVVSPDGSTREFGPVAGRVDGHAMIRRQRSFCGCHQIQYEYDKLGRLAWVQDSAGRHIGLAHDAQGRVVALKLPHPDMEGWVVHRRYAYDDAGDLVQVWDALDASWTFEYVTHLLTRETDRNGLSFYFLYDGLGEDAWCIRTWGDGGIYDHSIQYDKKNKITFVTDSLGNTKQYHMNLIGLVVKIVDARGGVTTRTYDPATLLQTAEADPIGRETRFRHDAEGNVIETIRPDGVSVWVEYGLFGRPVRAWDAIGGEWTWRHDTLGRMTQQTDPLGRTTSYRYDGRFLAEMVDPGGARTQVSYDGSGSLQHARLPNGGVRCWRYDRRGQVVDDVDPKGNLQRVVYDLEGRVKRVEEPDGNTRLITLDPEGNALRAQDVHRDITFEYGGRNRLLSRTEAGATVRFEYDTEQNLTGLINEHGFAYHFVYGPTGDLAEEIGFDGLRRVFTRDLAGQVSRVDLPEGRNTTYTYDRMGRVTAVQYHDGTRDTFVWRADGTLELAENETIAVRWERDALGRVLREVQGEAWVASEYDARGDRVALRSSLGAHQVITRDSMGDVLQVDSGHGRFVTRFERDLLGQEVRRILPGGAESRWERDGVGRPLRHVVTGGGGQVHRDVSYTWAPDLRLRQIEDAQRGRTEYGHDAWGNLAWSRHADGKVEIRNPDAVGNLFKSWDRSDRKYGAAGQILEAMTDDGLVRYEYDALGNLIRKTEPMGKVWTYAWDARGMLKEVTRPDGEVVTFTYDVIARRLSKSFHGATTLWVWDSDVPLHEWTAFLTGTGGRPTDGSAGMPNDQCNIFDPGTFEPLYSISNNRVAHIYFFEQTVDSHIDDGSAGAPQVKFIPVCATGHYYDHECQLAYNRWRYFDPRTAQFVSSDPIGLIGGLNTYAHVADCVVQADPLGLTPGIYWFKDARSGKTYVGQSSNIERRLTQHRQSGKLPPGTSVETRPMLDSTKTSREIAEFKKLREFTNGNPARFSQDVVSNKVDPLSETRQKKYEEDIKKCH